MTEPSAITRALVSAITHSAEPMVISNPHRPDDPVVAANQAFEALTGYSNAEIVGRNCRFLQGPRTDTTTTKRIRRHIDAMHGCIEWIINYRKDGTPFCNLLFISPVFDREGKLLHFFGNQQDITTGTPDWLDEFSLGEAHMPEAAATEFHRVLLDILEHESEVGARAQALGKIVAAARRLAQISTGLVPGAPDRAV